MSDLLQAARAVHELLGRERPGRWFVLVVLSLIGSAFEMLGALAIYLLMALLVSPGTVDETPIVGSMVAPLPTDDLEQLRALVALVVLAFFAVRGIVVVSRAYVEARLVTAAGVEVADRLLAGYLAMPYAFHTRRNTAELIRNAYTSTAQLQGGVMLPLATLVGDVLVVLGLTLIVLASEPIGGLLAVTVLVGVTLVIQRVLRPRLTEWSRREQDAAVGGLRAIQQSLGGIRDIKLLGQEETFRAAHRQHRERSARAVALTQSFSTIPRVLIELGMVSAVVVLTLVVLSAGASVDEALAAIGLFAYSGLRLQPVLQRIVTSVNLVRASTAMIDDLAEDRREVIAEARRVRAQVDQWPPPDTFRGQLRLRDVHFAYSADGVPGRPALRGVDLTIERGEFLGICGPTGGGKSTLLDLIIGLLEPTDGSVHVDGRPLGPAPTWWWAQLGVVSQQIFLTDESLRNNIAFGLPEEAIDEDRLLRCVERAQLAEFAQTLPEGLGTIVGERGIRLSGGQRQRVAVARALYREPPVIVLDEGTSALDGATEARLITALESITPNRTLVVVTHRLATIRHADRIIVVADGGIVDSGTYDGLLEQSTSFREFAGGAVD